jgi:DNA-binding NtrC family response regulator
VVLIGDDELEYAETLSLRLARRGLQVLTAGSAEQILEAVTVTRNLDVVLLSATMRGVDTIELLADCKRVDPRVEVILLAAHSSAETAIAGLRRGAFDYLLKPCDTEMLTRRIERARARKLRREQEDLEARILEITSRRV